MRFLLSCLLVFVLAAPAAAQWANDPALAPELSDGVRADVYPQAVTTPDGYTYLAWFQEVEPIEIPANLALYLQRLDPHGRPQWAAGGVMIDPEVGAQGENLKLKVTPTGDVWLAYLDRESAPTELRLRRVNSDGVQPWGADGIEITVESGFLWWFELAVCDDGTAFVGWSRKDGPGPGDFQALVQRVDPDGELAGLVVDLAPTVTDWLSVVIGLEKVTSNEVLLVWVTPGVPGEFEIRAQKVNADGTEQFAPGGILVGEGEWPLFAGMVAERSTDLVLDGMGGVYFTFAVGLSARLQHVEADGTLPWGLQGEPAGIDYAAQMVVDPESGEPTLFYEVSGIGERATLHGRRFDLAGELQWGTGAEPLIDTSPTSTVLKFRVAAVPGGTRLLVTQGVYQSLDAQSTIRSLFVDNDGIIDSARTFVMASGIGWSLNAGLAVTVGPLGDVINAWSEGPASAPDLKRIRAQNITANDEFGPAAGALSRNAGENLDLYTATVEPLGGVVTLDLTVPAPSGIAFGLVVGYAGRDAFSLAGYEVLVDISGSELLQLSPQLGPDVQYVIPIPASPLLAGAVIHTQGLQLGAGVQLVLTNAQDLYLGF